MKPAAAVSSMCLPLQNKDGISNEIDEDDFVKDLRRLHLPLLGSGFRVLGKSV